ncbi:helix-turn-helix domain-containing protein [Actinoallomurus spadix]|uniref:HTH cro/C1-type domain-containing protein n=1 Tax=Actinoallomurus spadix TaxID=79912 RepID=A0ABN0WUJ9_9ACTN|nr:helix-turn-helix domain-containing protein [Actinoallomurus spadix]
MPGQGSVGERVRNLRLSKHLSQAQLAGTELSDSYISLIESGKRTPTPAVVRLLASRLGCLPEYLSEGIEPEERLHLQVRVRHAELALLAGDADQALRLFTDILSAIDNDPDLAKRARWGQARALEARGDGEDAIKALEELREEASRDRGRAGWLPVIVVLARCYRAAGDLGRTIALGESALERLAQLGLLGGEEAAEVGRTLIATYLDRGDTAQARTLAERLLAASESTSAAMITAYRKASQRALDEGAGGEALYLAEQALALHAGETLARAQARLRVASARSLLPGDASAESATKALELLRAAEESLSGVDAAECLIETARSKMVLGEPGAAVTIAQRVLTELSSHPGGSVTTIRARLMLAQALVATGEREEALTALRATGDQLGVLPPSRATARVWRELGDLFGAAGDTEAMMDSYRKALESAGLRSSPQHSSIVANLGSR